MNFTSQDYINYARLKAKANKKRNMSNPTNVRINSRIDNAVDKAGTEASDIEHQALIASLWDRTFVAYAPEIVVRLPYYFQAHQSIGSNTLATINQFRINSLWDPDLTGVGNQPTGRDTWANIYDYYKVLETRIHVRLTSTQYATGTVAQTAAGTLTDGNAGPSYLAPTYVGGMMDITANPPTTLTSWQQATVITGNSQQRFTPIQILERIGSRKNTTVHYHMTWVPEMFDSAVINNSTQDTWTAIQNNPSNVNYFSAIVYNSNAGTNGVQFSAEVKVEFLAAFKNVNRALLNTVN